MEYLKTTPIILILLSVALLVAVGWVVFAVGRVVVAIVEDYWRERKPKPQFNDPRFGVFTFDRGLWSGEITVGEREITVVIDGAKSEPSKQLLVRLQKMIEQFNEVEKRALDFLRNEEEGIRKENLRVCGLSVLDQQKPDDFTIEFIGSGDDDRVWRVEFVGGEPKATGFDH